MIISAKKFFERYCPLHDSIRELFANEKYEELKKINDYGGRLNNEDLTELSTREVAIWHHKRLTDIKRGTDIFCKDYLLVPITENEFKNLESFIEKCKTNKYH